jgi:hypothetical protein
MLIRNTATCFAVGSEQDLGLQTNSTRSRSHIRYYIVYNLKTSTFFYNFFVITLIFELRVQNIGHQGDGASLNGQSHEKVKGIWPKYVSLGLN